MGRWRGAAVVLWVGMAGAAQAAPNGLTQIPIAKVFGDGVGDFSLERSQLGESATVYTAQYGLGNWFEGGVDYQAAPAGQQTLLGNLKVLLAHRPGRVPDVAAGLQNLAPHQKVVPYLVATTAPWKPDRHGRGGPGFSLGLIRSSDTGAYRLMGGFSYNLSANLQIVLDGISGAESYRTLGVIANLSKLVTLNLAYAQPNDARVNPNGFVLNLAYTLHLKGRGKPAGGAAHPGPSPK